MRDLPISYGNSCHAKFWSNKTIRWKELCEKLKNTMRTTETMEEYAKMKKSDREAAKDHGGFVAGHLKDNRRKAETVVCRSILALDGDKLEKGFLDRFVIECPYEACVYTTHSHTPDSPRGRFLIPLTRDVSPDEYVAIARFLAAEWGIDQFDECSYKPSQLMYWPTSSSNGEYIFDKVDGPWLDPDKYLSRHPGWRDCSLLPTSSRESAVRENAKKPQEDPLAKKGVVGAFCRTYSIEDVMEKFLSDVYAPSAVEGRYDFIKGEGSAGVVVYDGKFAYSHHATDPAGGMLLNAFDLVRIHRFGDEKDSFGKMCDFASADDEVKMTLAQEKRMEAESEFSEVDDWQKGLEYEPKSMVLKNTLHNLLLILQNDPNLKGMRYNEFSDGMEIEDAPWRRPSGFRYWREADDAQLVAYIDGCYGTFSARNYDLAVTKVCDDRSYHPVKDYFASLPEWDGQTRVDTLLINCFGSADNAYVRAVTRKTFVGAVARIMHPGCKFDTMLVMNGFQGQKKSSLLRRLCGDWFNDDISFAQTKDKTAAEKLQGYWIIEFSEMTGLRKADIEGLKAFISRQNDIYRASYGKRATPHMRQCIFIGTTNADGGFLRDTTGNRRYWPVKTIRKFDDDPASISDEFVRQFWAEALYRYNQGEKLYLEDESVLKYATLEQQEAMEADEREGIVADYLDRLLPTDWNDMDIGERRNFLYGTEFGSVRKEGKVRRRRVCTMEIWCECFGREKSQLTKKDSGEIAVIMARMPGWERLEGKQRFGMYGVVGGYEYKE